MARILDIHKAQSIHDNQLISGANISIVTPIPDLFAPEHFQDDAIALEETLYHNLPGGTYDRLLGLMLTRKASHFVVSHFKAYGDG